MLVLSGYRWKRSSSAGNIIAKVKAQYGIPQSNIPQYKSPLVTKDDDDIGIVFRKKRRRIR